MLSYEEGFGDDGQHKSCFTAELLCIHVGIADLLAALRKPQKRFQDAGRGPGSVSHPMGTWASW